VMVIGETTILKCTDDVAHHLLAALSHLTFTF